MIYVEIELDGVVTAKRCPKVLDINGLIDYQSIRNYFQEMGYKTGHIRIC